MKVQELSVGMSRDLFIGVSWRLVDTNHHHSTARRVYRLRYLSQQ